MTRAPLLLALLVGFGCSKPGEPEKLAPRASAAQAAPLAGTEGAVRLDVETPKSTLRFLMDSPLEKLDGDVQGGVTGELALDLGNLAKSTALVRVDLDKLVLYQQKRADEAGDYGERKKSERQNEHARDWLQIVAREGEVTAEQAAQHRFAEFRIDTVSPSVPSVLALSGPERKVTATVSGTFRLHGREAKKSAKVELTFVFEGQELATVSVRTVEPFPVSLEEFEIHPRDAAGKFLRTVTDALGSNLKGKLQKEAPVTLELVARRR
jgi:hypothetical protein